MKAVTGPRERKQVIQHLILSLVFHQQLAQSRNQSLAVGVGQSPVVILKDLSLWWLPQRKTSVREFTLCSLVFMCHSYRWDTGWQHKKSIHEPTLKPTICFQQVGDRFPFDHQHMRSPTRSQTWVGVGVFILSWAASTSDPRSSWYTVCHPVTVKSWIFSWQTVTFQPWKGESIHDLMNTFPTVTDWTQLQTFNHSVIARI